jgi:hypothetical protein
MPKVNWDNAPEELKELMCEMTSMIGKYEEYAEREVYEIHLVWNGPDQMYDLEIEQEQ